MLGSDKVTSFTRQTLRRIGTLRYTPAFLSQSQGEHMPDAGASTTADPTSSPTAEEISPTAEEIAAPSSVSQWHDHLASHREEVHAEMVEARETLHMGTPSDAIELANRDVSAEADEAAARWHTNARV